MKTNQPLLIAVLIVVIALASFAAGIRAQSTATHQPSPWHWPDSMDSVNAAPKNHKLLFENDHVRLLEVTVQPGETENMHGHKYPSVFIMDAAQPRIVNKNLADDAKNPNRSREYRGFHPPPPHADGTQYPTCFAMTTSQPPHQVTNTDTFPQHFYRIEFKKLDGDAIKNMTKYPAD